MRYAFVDLLRDTGKWLAIGIVLAGLITTALPADFIETQLGTGIVPMLAVLLVALPLYVCATASTPIAAAFMLKGLSPGAALVFLLVGPATNAAAFPMIINMLGKRSAMVFFAVLALVSVALGLLLDTLLV
jgi:hypothetical protein